MSSIFGLLNLSGNPIRAERLTGMRNALSHWEPDRSEIKLEKNIGLGQLMLCITPESLNEELPYRQNSLIITANARIDNREVLAKLLDISGPLERVTDSQFILAAFRKWREDCPKYLVGEYAFTIWDDKEQSLYCAKDAMGTRPLYYAKSHDHFIFSSEIKGIFASGLIDKELNDVMLGMHLLGFKGEKEQTTFKDIKILPAAHWLRVTINGVRIERYWSIDLTTRIRFKNDEEYQEAFREKLTSAISRRTRSVYPMGCLLSGGLDSTSIAGIILKKGLHPDMNLYSWAHPAEERVHDDRYYIDQFLDFHKGTNFRHQYLSGLPGYFKLVPELKHHFNEPFRDIEHYTRFQSYEQAKKDNVRLLMSGVGGDELTSNFAYEYPIDLFFSLNWLKMMRELVLIKRVRQSTLKGEVKRSILRPIYEMLKGQAKWGKGNLQYGRNYYQRHKEDIYINRGFIEECGLQKFVEEHEGTSYRHNPLVNPLKKKLHQNLTDGSLEISFNQRYHASLAFKTQYTYPLLDRDLIEFCMGLPPDQFHQHGKGRSLIRSSMAEFLPKNILERKKQR